MYKLMKRMLIYIFSAGAGTGVASSVFVASSIPVSATGVGGGALIMGTLGKHPLVKLIGYFFLAALAAVVVCKFLERLLK